MIADLVDHIDSVDDALEQHLIGCIDSDLVNCTVALTIDHIFDLAAVDTAALEEVDYTFDLDIVLTVDILWWYHQQMEHPSSHLLC